MGSNEIFYKFYVGIVGDWDSKCYKIRNCLIQLFCATVLVIFSINLSFRFVSSTLPPGSEELKGDEADTIINFKKALGIDDPDAAAMHMEVFLLCVLCIYALKKFENA